METISVPMVEYSVASFTLRGQGESGDDHLVCCNRSGVLIAAIDGIGHGKDAAEAAKAAASILRSGADEPVISLVQNCHEQLRRTRGVVLSLASIDTSHGLMTWLGVGNVQAVLKRAGSKQSNGLETLLLRGGVVGSQLPALQATVLPIAQGDTLYLATDGIRSDFAQSLTAMENPQRAANRILENYQNGNDDALVLVTRLTGVRA
ncbi:MAG TPA: SpoIIE family protein phosphatase [Candidatus Acidoferrum sp.]|nr:SpoIIE family protein phosphatase [Candidatus Acidoferrum sp.]